MSLWSSLRQETKRLETKDMKIPSIVHCGNIHSQNVKVNNGISLLLDATGYVLIPSNFEVSVGGTLSINP